jgi:hypothetical protein
MWMDCSRLNGLGWKAGVGLAEGLGLAYAKFPIDFCGGR